MKRFFLIPCMLVLILAWNACAPRPYSASNKTYKKQARSFGKILSAEPKDSVIADSFKFPKYRVGTTNFNMRKPNYVVLHHTAQSSCEQTLKTFTSEPAQVSAHYLICRDGTLYHLLNDYLRAWHAGAAKWGNETDINSSSIGIEIDNNGVDTFSTAQLNCLTGLLTVLKKKYNIPAANFIGHADIAPTRKVDPNVHFPWQQLAAQGFGLWYPDTTLAVTPENFNVKQALRIIGYDVSNDSAAIQAYRRHFLKTEKTGGLTEPEKKVLYVLMQKFL